MDRLMFRISSGEIDRESRFPSDAVGRFAKESMFFGRIKVTLQVPLF
ncbi:MAG: hypothetical protein LBT40_17400 [Deltaproteobacteria bacterium]|jgi:hypothetical protein|nr:hypothetical protein [Deltaproteobacteria bacterium]